jgi:hypothetical protein
MGKFGFTALALLLAGTAPAFAQAPALTPAAAVAPAAGKTVYFSTGQRVGVINRLNAAGDPQIIFDGQLVTLPATTLSDVGGKLTTSLTRKDVGRVR